jgi:hypothetical protein
MKQGRKGGWNEGRKQASKEVSKQGSKQVSQSVSNFYKSDIVYTIKNIYITNYNTRSRLVYKSI